MCPGPDGCESPDAGVLSQHARTGIPPASRSRDSRARDARSRDRGDRVPRARRHPGHADPGRMPFRGVRGAQHPGRLRVHPRLVGLCHAPARRLRRVDRVFHLLRGAAPGADAGQADRGDPGADGYRPRGHAGRRGRAESASPGRFPSTALLPRRCPRRLSSPRQASGRSVRRHDRRSGSAGRCRARAELCRGAGRGDRAARAGGRRVPAAGAVSAAPGRASGRRRGRGSRARWWIGWARRHPEASPTRTTCSCFTTSSGGGGRGVSRHRGSRCGSATDGTRSSGWRIAPRARGWTASRRRSCSTLRRAIARSPRTWRGRAPTGRTRPRSAGSSDWWRPVTMRCIATSGARGGVWRPRCWSSSPPRSCDPAVTS